MIVAVIAMLMVQAAVNEIVDVVSMRRRFMTTARTMDMAGFVTSVAVFGRAANWIPFAHLDHVLLGVAVMRVLKMPVVKKVDMIAVSHREVAAARPKLMRMLGVREILVIGHRIAPLTP
ncbi:hypothetical protein [Rhodoblastus sp.]|uniref:hypothetical protein n=1 Tax=Rhodoblastus sp. TaxID=1962975 RepID=UPI003F9766C4